MPVSTMSSIIFNVLVLVIVTGAAISFPMMILSMIEIPISLKKNELSKTVSAKPKNCGYCKHTLGPRDKHCTNCGAPVS